jgi:hypothetical protein
MDLKQIQITGNAKDDFEAMKAGKRKRASRKQKQQEEEPTVIQRHSGGTSPGTLISLQASSAPTTPGTPPPVPSLTTGLKTNPEGPAPVSALTQPGIPTQGGAKPKSKLILEPAQKKKEGMKLAAPKAKHQVNQTRKARKIRVSISGLGKRMTRHKKIQKEAKAVPLDQIKKKLIEVKLIKPDSKAPEQILRQIYADFETLKNKAL